jgi:hypothetical protein
MKSKKKNCWEFKKCGREPGGRKASEFGICPATTSNVANGINEGKNGGRICWAIAGTYCINMINGSKKVQGTFAKKRFFCTTCDFFKSVEKEQGADDFEFFLPSQSYKY